MRELNLYRQKLKYRELLMEKELTDTTVDLINHFSDQLKKFAVEFGTKMIWKFFKGKKQNKNTEKHNKG